MIGLASSRPPVLREDLFRKLSLLRRSLADYGSLRRILSRSDSRARARAGAHIFINWNNPPNLPFPPVKLKFLFSFKAERGIGPLDRSSRKAPKPLSVGKLPMLSIGERA